MKSTKIIGSKGFIEATIDGLTFYRTEASAAARTTPRRYQLEWAQVASAAFVEPPAGKATVRVTLVSHDPVVPTRDDGPDPHAMKVRRRRRTEAREFVRLVNEELGRRRAWGTHAPRPVGREIRRAQS